MKQWTTSELRLALAGVNSGASTKEIASILGRTPSAVRAALIYRYKRPYMMPAPAARDALDWLEAKLAAKKRTREGM